MKKLLVLIVIVPIGLFASNDLSEKKISNEQPTFSLNNSENQLGKINLHLDLAGFILFGPTLTLETKLSDFMYLTPHIRYYYLGALMYGLQTEFDTDNKWRAKSAAYGIGLRILPERASSPHRMYFGLNMEYGQVGKYKAGTDREYTEKQFLVVGNIGYRWRFDSRFNLSLGAEIGTVTNFKSEYYVVSSINQDVIDYPSGEFTTIFAMINLALGIESKK